MLHLFPCDEIRNNKLTGMSNSGIQRYLLGVMKIGRGDANFLITTTRQVDEAPLDLLLYMQ